MTEKKRVSFHTLGCKLNYSETSTIAREFDRGGFSRAQKGESADICIINTCSVTDHADKKCRNLIRRLHKNNPQAIIAVTGCYAQLKAAEIAAIEGVDIVVGNNQKGSIMDMVMSLAAKPGSAVVSTCQTSELTTFFAAFSSADRTRSFLKVQDGCNYKCSYCTIPLARGISRNSTIQSLVEEAKQIALAGQKEIVLTGVNIGDFGRTTSESFLSLLEALDAVEGIERYRISSIEPNLLTPEILSFASSSAKFMPHYHIPLQSGSDKILGLMRRRYTSAFFADKIAQVRQCSQRAFIGIDVIVGFPGESEQDFLDTYNFLQELRPAFIHVFPYSERANTPAIDYPAKVSPQESARRVEALSLLSNELHLAFSESFIGEKVRVLIEGTKKGGLMYGYTENYLKIEIPYRREQINSIVELELTKELMK